MGYVNAKSRYADDSVVHCKMEKEAQELKDALGEKLSECGLELNLEIPDALKKATVLWLEKME